MAEEEGPDSLRDVQVPASCTISRQLYDLIADAEDESTGGIDLSVAIGLILSGFTALEALVREGDSVG